MKLFGITFVKNEDDIIEFFLKESAKYFDYIFVVDNSSVDNTWQIVNDVAKVHKNIIPWKVLDEVFHDGLRARVFNEFKHLASDGDWWCPRLDCDEFYLQDPKVFLSTNIKPGYRAVCSKHIQFRLTEEMLDTVDFTRGFQSNIGEFKYIDRNATSECRYFMHRSRLTWNEDAGLPNHVGLFNPVRITLKHYQYRSPEQMQKRINTRMALKKQYPDLFPHVFSENWRDYLTEEGQQPLMIDTKINNTLLFDQLPFANNKSLKYNPLSLAIQQFLYRTNIWA